MLRYSAHYAVPMLFYFFTFSVDLFWQGACILRYSARHAVPMLFYFFTFSVIHFWQGVCILRYSVRYALRSLALNLRRGEDSCCHRAHCLSEASLREWQQTGAAAEQGAQRVTTSSLPPLAVPSPTEVPQPPLPPSHPAQRRWPKTSRAATPISHNQTNNQAATLNHNITTFTPSDTTPKHPPYKPQAAHKPPAAAQPGFWNSRPYKPRSTPYSAPYQ